MIFLYTIRMRFIRLSDFRSMFGASGPLFAFIVPWIIVLIGQISAICGIVKPIYSTFYLVIIGNILSICLIAFLLQFFFPQKLALNRISFDKIKFSNRFKKITYTLIAIYLFGQIFQIIYFKGFPLLWLLLRMNKDYFSFGIQSINGLLNAIYLLSTTSLFLIYLKERKKRLLILFLFMFIFPVMMITRQVMISIFLQVLCCSLIYNPKKMKKYGLYAGVVFLIFIVVGNYRTGLHHLIDILEPKPYVPKFLYSFLWLYAYFVTPFNNLNASFDSITSIGAPLFEISRAVPSVFRIFTPDMSETGFTLVHENMNVSTFYLMPLLDFGRVYSFLLMCVVQFLFILSYRRAIKSKSPVHILEYAVFFMIIILSIFDNLLFFLPVIFQLFIINLAKIKLKVIRGQNVIAIGKV